MKKLSSIPNFKRRMLIMLLAHPLFGFANALLKLTLLGNDPASAVNFALADRTGISFTIMMLIMNAVFFSVQFLTDRTLVGPGTFINWIFVGMLTDACTGFYQHLFTMPEAFPIRLAAAAVAILIFSLAASMYQTADLGISPYDSLSIALSRKIPIPYFWCRIFTDSVCTVLTLMLGGIINIGTLICALGVGPIIAFFNRHISQKLCGMND